MPQISLVGTGGDYTTIAAWEAGESGSDYGAGNPAIAEITGTVEADGIVGAWVRGLIMRAASGEEPVFRGGAGTAVVSGPSTVFVPSTASTSHEINDLEISGIDSQTSDSSIVTTMNGCYFTGANFARNANCTMRANSCLSVTSARAYDATSGADCVATNCTVVQTGTQFGFVRWKTENSFVYSGSGTGWAATISGSDYNASDDATAPGANSLTGRTTADFADYAGGDYRTASGSALATAGSGGTFIGMALEAGGGGGSFVAASAAMAATSGQTFETSFAKTVEIGSATYQAYSGQAFTLDLGSSFTPAAATYAAYSAHGLSVSAAKSVDQGAATYGPYAGQDKSLSLATVVAQGAATLAAYTGQAITVIKAKTVQIVAATYAAFNRLSFVVEYANKAAAVVRKAAINIRIGLGL